MNSRLPIMILALAWGAAILIGGLGTRVARVENTIIERQSLAPAQATAAALQHELDSLTERLRGHLAPIAETLPQSSQSALTASRSLHGVEHLALFQQLDEELNPIREIEVTGVPALPVTRVEVGGFFIGVDGWVDSVDESLLYWRQLERDQVAVIQLDRSILLDQVRDWLAQNPLPNAETATVIAPGGLLPDADHALAVPSRFGNWTVQLDFPRRSVVTYDRTLLASGIAIALLVATIGTIAFLKIRAALARAAQRVSFVNSVSHELRTPLTNIVLNTEIAEDLASPPVQKRLALVREETERLARLIENVLTFSKSDHGPVTQAVEPVSLPSLVDEVLAQFAPSLERRSFSVTCDLSALTEPILANPDTVRQILGNLISNVEKYAADGRVLDLVARMDDGRAILRISDRGPGIPEDRAETIFAPFRRLSNEITEGSSGTGLGLTIARDLAEAQNGTLRLVPSDSRIGATFELALPTTHSAVNVVPFEKTA